MATINNLSQAGKAAAQNALDNGQTTPVTGQDGVSEFTTTAFGKVFTSGSDVNLNGADNAFLTGNGNANVQGNGNANLVVGNDGNNDINVGDGDDQVSTGAGNDNVILGSGDDVVEIDGAGTGTKVIDGGTGNDTFVIKASGLQSVSTFTGLNSGDKLRISADANGDGKIDMNDVKSSGINDNGDAFIELTDGTKFTLEGVKAGPFDGALKYDITTDEDGNLVVDITDGTV